MRSDDFDSNAAMEFVCQNHNLWHDNTDTNLLQDGVTTRITLATATVGTTPLPLPVGEVGELETLRDQVATASNAFVKALDRLLRGSSNQPLLRTTQGVAYSFHVLHCGCIYSFRAFPRLLQGGRH